MKKRVLFLGIWIVLLAVGCGSPVAKPQPSQIVSEPTKVARASPSQLPLPLPQVQTGWQRRVIGTIGSIDFPQDIMEEQNRAWRQSGEAESKAMGLPVVSQDTVIIQQKGLARFARIIISEFKGTRGEFNKLSDRNYVSVAELKDFDVEMNRKTKAELSKIPGMKVLEFYPARLQDVNGMQPLVISYRRQLGSNPPVLVWGYTFMNDERMMQVEMSYRQTEDDIWAPVFQKCLASLRILPSR